MINSSSFFLKKFDSYTDTLKLEEKLKRNNTIINQRIYSTIQWLNRNPKEISSLKVDNFILSLKSNGIFSTRNLLRNRIVNFCLLDSLENSNEFLALKLCKIGLPIQENHLKIAIKNKIPSIVYKFFETENNHTNDFISSLCKLANKNGLEDLTDFLIHKILEKTDGKIYLKKFLKKTLKSNNETLSLKILSHIFEDIDDWENFDQKRLKHLLFFKLAFKDPFYSSYDSFEEELLSNGFIELELLNNGFPDLARERILCKNLDQKQWKHLLFGSVEKNYLEIFVIAFDALKKHTHPHKFQKYQFRAFESACAFGSQSICEFLIEENYWKCSQLKLIRATKKGLLNVVKFLLKNRIKDFDFLYLFTIACDNRQFEIARLFQPLVKNWDAISIGETAFTISIKNNLEISNLILDKISESELLNLKQSEKQQNILAISLENRSIQIAKRLISLDFNLKFHTQTALHLIALSDEMIEMIPIILSKDKNLLNELNEKNQTPLQIAMNNKSNKIAQQLIQSGAAINQPSLIFDAIENDLEEVTKLLIEKHPSFLKALNKENELPLFFACKNGKKSICDLLIQQGADFFDQEGNSLYPYAERYGYEDIKNQIEAFLIETVKTPDKIGHFDIPDNIFKKIIGNKEINDELIVDKAGNEYWVSSKILVNYKFFKNTYQLDVRHDKRLELPFELPIQFIKFLYTKRITITHENFKELARFANYFLLETLRKELRKWLIYHPECENWNKLIA